MNKKTLIIVVVVLLVIVTVGGIFAMRGNQTNKQEVAPTPTPEDIQSLKEDELSVSVAPVDEAKGRSVDLTISKFPDGVDSFEYEITYSAMDKDGSFVPQGVIGSPVTLDGRTDYNKVIFLGSCSKNVCVAHLGVKEVLVLVRLNYKDGSVKQWKKSFKLESN